MTFEGREHPNRKSIIECPDCGITAYPQYLWKAMSKEERQASGGRLRTGDQCDMCYRGRPSIEEPPPGEEFIEPECKECGSAMVTRAHWRDAGPAEREELIDEGYRVIHSIESNLCRRCHGIITRREKVPA